MKKWEDAISMIATIFFIMIFGFIVGYISAAERYTYQCPTEDSCIVDYYDGEWHIKEVTP